MSASVEMKSLPVKPENARLRPRAPSAAGRSSSPDTAASIRLSATTQTRPSSRAPPAASSMPGSTGSGRRRRRGWARPASRANPGLTDSARAQAVRRPRSGRRRQRPLLPTARRPLAHPGRRQRFPAILSRATADLCAHDQPVLPEENGQFHTPPGPSNGSPIAPPPTGQNNWR